MSYCNYYFYNVIFRWTQGLALTLSAEVFNGLKARINLETEFKHRRNLSMIILLFVEHFLKHTVTKCFKKTSH